MTLKTSNQARLQHRHENFENMVTSQRTLVSVHFNPSYFTTKDPFVMQTRRRPSTNRMLPSARCCGKARPRQFVVALVNGVFAMPTRLLSVSNTV